MVKSPSVNLNAQKVPPEYNSSNFMTTASQLSGQFMPARFKKRRRPVTFDARPRRRAFATGRRRRKANLALLAVEEKFLDLAVTTSAFAATWTTMGSVTAIPTAVGQGDSPSNRDGRVFYVTSIHFKGFVSRNALEDVGTPASDVKCRIVIFVDNQTNRIVVDPATVMNTGFTEDINAFTVLSNEGRYKILFDRTIVIKAPGTNAGGLNLFADGTRHVPWHFNHTFPNGLRCETDASTASVVAMTTKSIQIIGIANDTTALFDYHTRCRFKG